MDKTEKSQLEGLRKKQSLIISHYEAIGKLKIERSKFNKKIASVEKRLHDLLSAPDEISQLKMFDDLDVFLKEGIEVSEID